MKLWFNADLKTIIYQHIVVISKEMPFTVTRSEPVGDTVPYEVQFRVDFRALQMFFNSAHSVIATTCCM